MIWLGILQVALRFLLFFIQLLITHTTSIMSEATPLLGSIGNLVHAKDPRLSPSSEWSNLAHLRALSKAATFVAWLINVVLASPIYPGSNEWCLGSADILNFVAGMLSLLNAQVLQPRLNVLANKRLWGSFTGEIGDKVKRSVTQHWLFHSQKDVALGEEILGQKKLPAWVSHVFNFFAITNLYAAMLEGSYAFSSAFTKEERTLYRFACYHDVLMLVKRVLTLTTAICSFTQMTNLSCLHHELGAWLSFVNILATGVNLYLVSECLEWAGRKQDAAAAAL